MLGRPPSFGGGKTEVYDFMGFKEQLYNVLAYAEPKFTDAFKNLERLGDDEHLPERFEAEEHQAMSTKLYSLLSSWLTGTTKQHARDPTIASSRNGFALWKSLLRIYQPSTRSRSFGSHASDPQLSQLFTRSKLSSTDLQVGRIGEGLRKM